MAPNRPFLKSLGRKISRLRRSSAIRQVKRSLAGFTLGLFLASVYGMTALFIQNNDLWFCVTTTGILAAFAGFGTGLSDRVRTNVMLMIPMLCSIRGKNFLLFLICTLVIHGPVSNTMENVERAADSVICGAELAMNQTQQLLQRAANPLLPALSKIKEMARNAYSMAGRAQNLIRALTESVRHVARVLRKVLHFLADIGDVCNDKLGLPYQKCTRLFDEGRENCMELLSVFSFLCHILDGFQSLCGLARVGQLFCILPSYIADHMKTALAYPTIVAFDRIKKEFEFNISTSINFDLLLNNSQSMQDAAQEIMEEVSEQMGLLLELKVLLAYMGFFLLLFMYLKAVLYKNRYLHNDKFENIYITDQFIELDRKLSRQGKAAVLPLSHRETLTYIRPCSLYLTARERRAMAGQMLSLFRYMVMTVILIAVDLMVFWVFELVHHQAQGEIVTQGLLYGFTLFIVIAGGYVKRLQRFVCARYHPEREKKRIQYLHRHILTHRGSLGKALLRAVQRNKVDQQNNGFIQTLAKHLPGGVIIARLLDINKESCMACGKMLETRGHDDEVHICPTTHCTGRYCSLCFRLMGNLCAICMGPLTFQEEQELDSSDEEQADLLEAAVTSQQTSQGIEMKKVMISFSNQDHSVWLNGQSSHQNIVVNNRV
ncbi:DC-STAMP domain-containing protein 2 isoform X3 [Rhinichthys klamathensis goyatoka]|uniref:DC-STAMP domain-containing protein 2 isoform X3 n=1 Tax=Rhinichthys klamathensis goyatoka TaxID=3034132 RepID=UPI0024B4D14D|nr:DC-STAMP domain-containing protein 2 isoform X3 [Rhinichthys klamathensis goyatoka]